MAIIGQSKNKGLYEKVTGEGSKYRELDYKDVSSTRPLIYKDLPGPLEDSGGTGLISDVSREAVTRIDDTGRILKLLTKYQGIKWQGHNLALTSIQNNLDNKRGKYVTGSSDLGILGNIGRGILKTLDWDAVTLAQVAVAGTGEHFSAWQSRAYLNSSDSFGGVLADLAAQVGIGKGGSAAQVVLSGGKVLVNPDSITGRQIPTKISPEAKALKPKGLSDEPLIGTETKTTSIGNLHWNVENRYKIPDTPYEASNSETYLSELNLSSSEDPLKFKPDSLFRLTEGEGNFQLGTDEGSNLDKVRMPTPGQVTKYVPGTVKTGLDESNQEPITYGTRRGEKPRLNTNIYSESSSYISSMPGPIISGGFDQKITRIAINPSPSSSPLESSSKGPWRPDGIQSLVAAKTSNKEKGPSDNGYNITSEVTFQGKWTRGDASTRVDNGRIEMIPFYIRAICPEGESPYGQVPSEKNGYLFFEANLSSYSENYEANWQGTEYIGRADKFWNYNGFDRNISFSFKMVAHSKSHLKPIYNRLNGLLSMTAPTYGGGSFMRGTLAEITIGDLLSEQLGFIKSVNLKWETDYMWETDTATIMVPHVLDVSINFTPIHQFVPHTDLRYFQLVNSGSGDKETFIVNHNLLYSTGSVE